MAEALLGTFPDDARLAETMREFDALPAAEKLRMVGDHTVRQGTARGAVDALIALTPPDDAQAVETTISVLAARGISDYNANKLAWFEGVLQIPEALVPAEAKTLMFTLYEHAWVAAETGRPLIICGDEPGDPPELAVNVAEFFDPEALSDRLAREAMRP